MRRFLGALAVAVSLAVSVVAPAAAATSYYVDRVLAANESDHHPVDRSWSANHTSSIPFDRQNRLWNYKVGCCYISDTGTNNYGPTTVPIVGYTGVRIFCQKPGGSAYLRCGGNY